MNDQTSNPRRTCDIVMKGGITSGVVFPQAITALSKRFDFKNIGGTSAGAIAAAGAAAAQYRRVLHQSDDGFDLLSQLPDRLGTPFEKYPTRLLSLFQPNAGTRRLYAVLTGALGGGGKAIPRMLRRVAQEYWGWMIIGGVPGCLLLGSVWLGAGGPLAFVWSVVSLILLAVGALLCASVAFVCEFVRETPRNNYGLCSGFSDPATTGQTEPLTLWLTRFLNEVAGLVPDGDPLTFGQLWGTQESDPEKAERAVNLEMMTTCLSHGRPYRLPFRDDEDLHENHKFYFRQDDFKRLFPKNVLEWMVSHPRGIPENEGTRASDLA